MVVQGEVSKASAIRGFLWEGILSDADDDSHGNDTNNNNYYFE